MPVFLRLLPHAALLFHLTETAVNASVSTTQVRAAVLQQAPVFVEAGRYLAAPKAGGAES
jgi:hypothetical protein